MSRFLVFVGLSVPYVLAGLACVYVLSTIVGILPAIMLVMYRGVPILLAVFAIAPAIGSVTLLVLATILLFLCSVVSLVTCFVRECRN